MPPRIRINQSATWTPSSHPRARRRCPARTPIPSRCLHTTTPIIENEPPIETLPPSPPPKPQRRPSNPPRTIPPRLKTIHSPQYDPSRAPQPPSSKAAPSPPPEPLIVTPSLREHLPLLKSQPPHYATIHLHGKPYLVTAGDTIRLPFLMHGVKPGDVLRLDRATSIGSRDFTLLGGVPNKSFVERANDIMFPSATTAPPIIGKTEDLHRTPHAASATDEAGQRAGLRKKGPPAYVDERLFVCRAVVMGTESEPLRVKEKTKRRQRHVKRVKSKHRFTVVRVRELRVRGLGEVEGEDGDV